MEFVGPLWRGGSGRPGTKGGWGYRCQYCNEGTNLQPMRNKREAAAAFVTHMAGKHPDKEQPA